MGNKSVEALEPRRLFAGGEIDPFFGRDGFTDTPVPGGDAEFMAMGTDPAGRVLLVARKLDDASATAYLFRYTADGTLDGTFGNHGLTRLDSPDVQYGNERIAFTPDGKLIIAAPDASLMQRFNSDGSLDQTFAAGGTLRDDSLLGVLSLGVQSDGKIVLGGFGANGPLAELWRLNLDGTSDTTFGTAGSVRHDFFPDDVAEFQGDSIGGGIDSIRLLPDDSMLVGAEWNATGTLSGMPHEIDGTAIAKFDSDGHIFAERAFELTSDSPPTISVIAAADGGAFGLRTSPSTFTDVVRVNRDLSVDTNFSSQSVAQVFASISQNPFQIIAQADGKLLALAFDYTAEGTRIYRFLADGSPDSSFGAGGSIDVSTSPDANQLNALENVSQGMLARDGSLLLGGDGLAVDESGARNVQIQRRWRDDSVAATLHARGAIAGKTQVLTVTYRAQNEIDQDSLDGRDLRITGPNRFVGYAKFDRVVSDHRIGSADQLIVRYKLSALQTTGTYLVRLRTSQVLDTGNHTAAGRDLGLFRVARSVRRGLSLDSLEKNVDLPFVSHADFANRRSSRASDLLDLQPVVDLNSSDEPLDLPRTLSLRNNSTALRHIPRP